MKVPRDLDAALERLGYVSTRQSGSHIRLHCSDPAHSITIPNHRPIKIGTLAAILTDVIETHRIKRDELLVMLFG